MTSTTATRTTLAPGDFKVADLSLATYGRKEIHLAQHEMPGLMALREEFAEAQPLAGLAERRSRMGPGEQGYAERPLQLMQQVRDRRGRDADRPGRGRDAAGPADLG